MHGCSSWHAARLSTWQVPAKCAMACLARSSCFCRTTIAHLVKKLNATVSIPSLDISVPITLKPVAGSCAAAALFTPPTEEPHELEVLFDGDPLPGLPVTLAVVDKLLQPADWTLTSTAFSADGGTPVCKKQDRSKALRHVQRGQGTNIAGSDLQAW